jgi:hypothetical protein
MHKLTGNRELFGGVIARLCSQQQSPGGLMINVKVLLAGLPIYVVVAVLADTLLSSGDPTGPIRAPVWLAAGFCVTALLGAGILLGHLVRRRAVPIVAGPDEALRVVFDWEFFVSLVVSGAVGTAGKAAATVLLGGHPWWVLTSVYALGYAAGWVVLVRMLARRAQRRATGG